MDNLDNSGMHDINFCGCKSSPFGSGGYKGNQLISQIFVKVFTKIKRNSMNALSKL